MTVCKSKPKFVVTSKRNQKFYLCRYHTAVVKKLAKKVEPIQDEGT